MSVPVERLAGELPDERRCVWTNGRERCHWPGTCSDDVHGKGPWYCGGHFMTRSGNGADLVLEAGRHWRVGQPRPKWRDILGPNAAPEDVEGPELVDYSEPGSEG